jgi:hypothetical protein
LKKALIFAQKYVRILIELNVTHNERIIKMIKQLIEQAIQIEAETDANINGALVQVTDGLSFEECEQFLLEWSGSDQKKAKRYAKKLARVKDDANPYHTIHGLRHDIYALIESSRNPRSDKNHLWTE